LTLGALGYEADEASTGEQALALLAGGGYDVVLLDLEMPGMGGFETCKEIQKLFPRPAVLILSVRDGKEDKAKAFAAGADDYLTKPFRFGDLLEHIQTARGGP
jgi:two-component system KDP operon response regulator KdpE